MQQRFYIIVYLYITCLLNSEVNFIFIPFLFFTAAEMALPSECPNHGYLICTTFYLYILNPGSISMKDPWIYPRLF